MDLATTRLHTLLAAAAASARLDAPPPLSTASAAIAAFSAEDLAFWDAADAPTSTSVGLLLASAGVADVHLVRVLRALLEAPLFRSSAGVLRVAREAVCGLKLARRWHALELASDELPDAVHARLMSDTLDASTVIAPLALELWLELLLGCQHSAALFQRSLAKLADTAAFLAEQRTQHRNDPERVAALEAMVRHFVLACAALLHCHRGYEYDAYLLQLALTQAFTADDVSRPTAASVEALLRATAWVQPLEQLGEFVLPTIDGKWVADDFASDQQHASGASVPLNAGSVLLRRTGHAVAYDVRASVQHRDGSQKLRLSGAVFQPLAELQALKSTTTTPWELEGHWSQVYEATTTTTVAAAAAPVAVTSAASTPWTCQACTMANDAAASKCATCGTTSPSRVAVPTPFDDVQGSNPAPFRATFDASHAFMRMQWSRGEQHGVWLARTQQLVRAFDSTAAVAALSDQMSDAASVPLHAYSASGRMENVLLLEKPVVSSGAHPELTVQVWVRRSAANGDDSVEPQVVLGYGSEFQLVIASTGELVWEIAGGAYTVAFPHHPLAVDTFHHVTLSLGSRTVELAVDGVSTGEQTFSDDVRNRLFATRSPVFTIGGSLVMGEAGASVTNVLSGAICDLRIWATLQPSVPVTAELAGGEANLLGYYPLVGHAQRVLLDLSPAENHATVFEAYRPRDVFSSATKAPIVVTNSFAPTVEVPSLPVTLHFASALGSDFVGAGTFTVVDGMNALRIKRGLAGAALWQSSPVSILAGFQTSFQLERASDHDAAVGNVVFALTEATYWNMSPLIADAETLFGASPSGFAQHSEKTALFVTVTACESGANGSVQCTIGLFVRSRNHNYKLAQARNVAVSSATTPSINVTYRVPEQLLSVALGADEDAVFECAVDIPRALGLESASTLRVGLVFPASASQDSDVRLDSWRYEELTGTVDASAPSLLASVYSGITAFQPTKANHDAGADKHANTVLCTRSSTDGSAIEQDSYGCQTCNLVHGSAVCRVCASVCHEGHELVAMGVMSSACACQSRGAALCRCSTGVNADDFPQLQHPVATALWCCSKCTVINATALTECSICGNKAPRGADSAPTAHLPSPPTSSSRALVLVPSPEPTPQLVEWSCVACTMLNAGDATKCTICDTARPNAPTPTTSAADGMLALYNAAEDVAKKSAASTGPWFCSACTMENKSTDDTCYMCSTPRAVPVAAAVDEATPEVVMSLPTPDPPLLPVPIDLTLDPSASETRPHGSSLPSPRVSSVAVENLKFLREYKQTVAEAICPHDVVDALRESSWETTAGALTLSLQQSFVTDLVEGTYADRDGYLSGIARVTADGTWKMDGKFKKLTQTQENALVLQWDASATRFDGKWFRGDGSGDWKCVLAPTSSDFRGLNVVEDAKDRAQLQPFYSGLINMKQNLTNVCYQNSFLQTLFVTQAFRRLILSADLAQYAHSSSTDVLACVQDLFARMLASQRPSLDSHRLQRCLPPTFQAGRQQDTSDFAHYLIDSLSEQLNSHPDTVDSVSDIFGGIQATVLACKTCGKTSVKREYFWELLLNLIDLRYTPITSITAVSGSSMNIATPSGYERLNTDVNKDRTGAPYVFLCVKRSPERTSSSAMDVDDADVMPITDLVVKVAPSTDVRPTMPGYERVELDLNFGGSVNVVGGKKQVFLFTRREPNGSPITDLQVIYGSEGVPDGFKQIRVDLNQGEGTKVFLCYRCDMPLTDLKIVNSGIPGYKMIDHLLNLSHDDAAKQYLAYQVGGNEPCLTDLELVTGDDVAQYQEAGWTSIGSPTSVAFNLDAPLDDVPRVPAQLMIRRGHGNPIFAIDVFRAPRQVPKYNDYEVIDVYPRAANAAADAVAALKGDWMASEDVDRTRKAVRIHAVSAPIAQALVVKGNFEDKGEIAAVATTTASLWSQAGGLVSGASNSSQVYRMTGHWKASKAKQAQLFDVELRPDAASGLYVMSGTIGDGKGRSTALQGRQTTRSVKVKWPISELLVLRGDEKVPDGVKIVSETVSGRTGNLLAQTTSPHSLYLAVKREAAPASGQFVSDVCVIYGEIDAVPDAYTCIGKTPGGFSANLNDGTAGVPVFVCYRRATGATHEKVLMDVAPMWTSGPQVDAVPAEFTKIQHTPLGMDANVNQGTTGVAIHLCFAKTDPAHVVVPVETPVNGEYEVTSAVPTGFSRFLSLSAAESVTDARVVEGKFGTILHGHLPGAFRATAFTSTQSPQSRRLLGVWSLETQTHPTTLSDFMPASYPCEWRLNDAGDELDGWWSGCDEPAAGVTVFSGAAAANTSASTGGSSSSSSGVVGGGSWKLLKDASVRIGFKKDYGTEWKDGQLIASERVWRHDLASMLARFDATRTLGGDNALECSQCARKTESRTHTVVVAPPAHLILTVKRMYYDWTQQKTRKSLHDVAFPALLALPPLSPEDEAVVFGDEHGDAGSDDRQRRRHYGLYGVLIHSGMTANSGHYYSFCRESDDTAQELHLEDSPSAPWIKFNDTKVERSHWAEINRLVANSVSDAVYLLLYKKLSYPVPEVATAAAVVEPGDLLDAPSVSGDDEEAMLLAKAMALSMSAAGRKRASVDSSANEAEETKRDGDEEETSDGAKSEEPHRQILPTILKAVEKENTTFLLETLSATSSSLHAADLHSLLVLRRGVPLQVRTILEQ